MDRSISHPQDNPQTPPQMILTEPAPMSSWDVAKMEHLQCADSLTEWQREELAELEALAKAWAAWDELQNTIV